MRLVLIILLFPLQIFAQDYTGVWVGTIYNDTTQRYIPYEIAIAESKGKLIGYSHTTFNIDGKEEVGVKAVKIVKAKDKIFIEDESLVFNTYTAPPPKGVKQRSMLSLGEENSGIILSGPFNTNRTREYLPLTGTIHLTKKESTEPNKILSKLDELKLSNALSFVSDKNEKKEVVKVKVHEEQITASVTETKEAETVFTPLLLKETPPIAHKRFILKNSTSIARVLHNLTPPVIQLPEIAITQSEQEIKKTTVVTDKVKEKEKNVIAVTTTAPSKIPPPVPQQKEIVKAAPKNVVNTPQESQKKVVEKEKAKDIIVHTQPLQTKTTTPVSQPAEKEKQNVLIPIQKQQVSVLTSAPVISAEELAKRKIETIRSVYFKTDSLRLTLYDNGEVDGDTVSVILNGKVIMPKQGLTAGAITKTVYITPDLGDSLQLIMYAENLGSIAPNTGLLIIQDGDERHEIRFAGDLKKNSAIILRRNRSLSQ